MEEGSKVRQRIREAPVQFPACLDAIPGFLHVKRPLPSSLCSSTPFGLIEPWLSDRWQGWQAKSSHHFVESGSPRRSAVQDHSLMNQMLLEDGQCFVPQQNREGHCQDYERALHLPHVDGLKFGQVRRCILGKRCRQLKRIERLTGATLTLHGPTPCYLTVQHARPEGLEHAVAMTNALLESLFGDTGWQEHDRASAPSSSALGCLASVPPLEQYLTEGEMILMLTRLGLTHAGDLVAEMRLSGLPFGESLPMPSVSGPHVEESMCGAYARGRV